MKDEIAYILASLPNKFKSVAERKIGSILTDNKYMKSIDHARGGFQQIPVSKGERVAVDDNCSLYATALLQRSKIILQAVPAVLHIDNAVGFGNRKKPRLVKRSLFCGLVNKNSFFLPII